MDFDVDLDALLDEEEEIMGELRSEAFEEETSRKRTAEKETDLVPRKQRKSSSNPNCRPSEDTARELLEADKENDILPHSTQSRVFQTPLPDLNDGQLVISEETEVLPELESSVVMTERPEVTSDYVTVCGEDGSRFYLNVRSEMEIDDEDRELGKMARQKVTNLTDEAFDLLLEKARLERKRWETEPINIETPSDTSSTPTHLWVDKYSPRAYTDLLSEEYVNRALLTWLKSWDSSVFGRSRRHKNRPQTAPPVPGQPVVSLEMDPSGRPQQKVALLCGPPGLGKTTLAYIAARHCGYSVIEINASDDRSPDVFRQRLESGSNTRYSVGGDQRPLCLIMDEIDGSSVPAIDVLVTACKAGTGGKKKDQAAILRPVICVCNDLYAPALRQLRPLAFVVQFPTPQISRLALRLLDIIRQEAMKADIGTLSSLAERSERDIRSCLNTLQFLRGRGHSEITQALLSNLNLGHKDVQKGLYFAWSQIFTMPRPQNASIRTRLNPTGNPLARRAQNVLQACGRSAGGDWQRLVEGLHENFLDMRFKDNRMLKVCGAYEWLLFVDSLGNVVNKIQDYSLFRYKSYLAVYFHINFATSYPGHLQWPQAPFINHQQITRTRNILNSLSAGCAPISRFSHRTLIVEVLPILVDILQPSLRPVNTQLYSERERVELMALVATMIQFGLNLRQERSPEGQYDFVLEPDLSLVARFASVRQTKSLSYAAKQLLARELSMEKMRRMEVGHGPRTDKPAPKKAVSSPSVRQQAAWSITEQVKQVRSKGNEKSRDFFGRIVPTMEKKLTESVTSDKGTEKSPLNEKIWFRFKEGYSNAIRRPVRIKDLL